MAKFNERLKSLRRESGLSQQDFAKQLGTSKSSINMYERGEREPGLEMLEAMADYFNVDMDYLLGKSTHKSKSAWLEGVEHMACNDTAQKIKSLRLSQNLTLEQVANEVGVGKSTVRKWETGMIANMRRDKIASLAKALHTSPAYLMGWDETEQPVTQNDDQLSWHLSESNPALKSESVQNVNIVKIAGRDGRFIEKELNDKELQALIAFVDLLPDASDDL